MKKSVIALAAVAFAAIAAAPAEARVRAGMLTCQVAPGVSFVLGSQKSLDCQFKSVRGYRERYVGRITRIGLDVGFTTGGTIIWAVYAPARPGPGALAGGYGGASAEATVAAGVGANALIGGFRRSITLQPLSVGAQKGLDLAVAVSGMELEYVRR
jgi:hypothetical protein